MILCFNCSQRTKDILERLVDLGKYKDHSEIIAVALENLALLEEQFSEQGIVMFKELDEVAPPQTNDIKTNNTNRVKYDRSFSKNVSSRLQVADPLQSIPNLFLLDGTSTTSPHPAKLPSDVWTKGQEVPIDRWIFGQYNRLLPAKVSCRALANLTHKEKSGISLSDISARIENDIVYLGDLLAAYDEIHKITGDELLSTAFPTSGKGVEKSILRFTNQFVANVNKHSQISGLLIDLKLINRIGTNNVRIQLTQPGWHFATLPNPVLDQLQTETIRKFTEEEIRFLIDHIKSAVPAEEFAYRMIIRAIEDGASAPESMDAYLQRHVSISTDRSTSDSFLSSQRSGAVSRMTDLELVKRLRDGVRVSYTITQLAKELFL
jgi:hypothetical protein